MSEDNQPVDDAPVDTPAADPPVADTPVADDLPIATDVQSDKISPRQIDQEMRQSFLDYAMSVIVSRALPDARDGLKPVHRRILYAMGELGMSHTASYKKSANVVGEVLGKYHPHGDSSIYDAMVRMAQDWSLRYPMVDGQGNFGSVDGDSAAAMRYTEARLAKVASQMLSDIDKNTVDWGTTYDGARKEPRVLPAAIPNLLINGSDGIAVGMATRMPPHNLSEVIDATLRLIEDPNATMMDLLEHIQGPDFPTGGIIYGRSGILQALNTGKGRIVVRGKHHVEPMGADRDRIVFEELPYQVNKATLLMAIADLAKDKVIEGISDLRDESDRRGMRMVIELKRDAITDVVLNQLWKHTALQSSYSVNNVAIVDGRPRTLNVMELLKVFLAHRFEVVTRRTQFELDKAQARAHIVSGLLTALDQIDAVVALIRASADAETARAGLMSQFGLSEIQSKAILDMRLQKLTGLESDALRAEFEELQKKIEYYMRVLGDPAEVYAIIREELLKVKDDFGDVRRTTIEEGEIDIDDESLIPEEQSVFTFTQQGYLKRLPLDTYREQNRGGKGLKGMASKDDDFVVGTTVGSTHDYLCLFTNTGRVHWLKGYKVPFGSRQSRGKPVQNLVQLDEGETVETIIPVRDFEEPGAHLFFATKKGIVKRTELSAFKNVRVVGIKAINLAEDDALLGVRKTDGERHILIASRNGQCVHFLEGKVRSMGRVATGVRGMTMRPGDEVVGLAVAEPGTQVLTVTQNGFGKRTPVEEYRETNRGGKGVRTIKVTERNGDVVAIRTVIGDEGLLLVTKSGMVVRTRVADVSQLGRDTQGVTIMRLNGDDEVMQVAVLPPEETPDDSDESSGADGDAAAPTNGASDEADATAPEAEPGHEVTPETSQIS